MKRTFLTPLVLLLFSFSSNTINTEVIVFKDDFGKLAFKKDFLVVDYGTDKYLHNIKYVQMLIFLDRKNYLGSVDEKEYDRNKSKLINKYQEAAKKKLPVFEYTNKSLRVERINKRCYFFYYEQLVELDFGRKMSGGGYCIGGHQGEYQVKEKNIIVILYYDGIYKYGERISKDEKDNIKSHYDFTPEHLKTMILN